MIWRPVAALSLGLLLGGLCVAELSVLHRSQIQSFARDERYFEYPIPVIRSMVKLRRDSFGKGYFGASRDGGRQHEGVDLAVDIKMPVYAAKSGRVVFAGVGKGYGKYVEISHPDGHSTRYAHLSELCCQKGDWVIRGCVIGVSGRTGNAANPKIHPHLHFEIRKQGKPLDPAEWMNPAIQMRQK